MRIFAIIIFSNTKDPKFLEQLTHLQATALAKFIKRPTLLSMIEILMETSKDYKYVTSINPVFEITLLKLVNMFEPKIKEGESNIVIEPEVFDESMEEETIVTPIVEEVKVTVSTPLYSTACPCLSEIIRVDDFAIVTEPRIVISSICPLVYTHIINILTSHTVDLG